MATKPLGFRFDSCDQVRRAKPQGFIHDDCGLLIILQTLLLLEALAQCLTRLSTNRTAGTLSNNVVITSFINQATTV